MMKTKRMMKWGKMKIEKQLDDKLHTCERKR